VLQCTRPDLPGYETASCVAFREEERPRSGVPNGAGLEGLTQMTYRRMAALAQEEICGADRSTCKGASAQAWQETIRAAERWNDVSASCRFTALIGYEFSMTPEMSKVHRNVIFRGSQVTKLPVSWVDESTPWGLWRRLRAECLEAGNGCDVLTIPHNSNLSNGRLFEVEYGGASSLEQRRAAAALRARMEPQAEIMQVKGDMECRNDLWNVVGRDEQCEFEKLESHLMFEGMPDPGDCRDGTGVGAMAGKGCRSRLDFLRYAWIEGQRQEQALGINPFKVGAIASTDGHDGAPGDVDEHLYDGASGRRINDFRFNPGGLAAVWAEENSRDAIFAALRRRETYGTSGPRMSLRFFGGWDLPESLCGDPGMVGAAYAAGVPMGGDLPAQPPEARGPVFVASALRDPGTTEQPGGLLQRLQVIKAWSDGDQFHQRVFDVAAAQAGASVDPETCEPRGPGADRLCAVWTDPEFDASRPALYYLRVLENPSCRYTQRLCIGSPAEARPEVCEDARIPKLIQERAWTSPIWYAPR
jgi:hypothetical protein